MTTIFPNQMGLTPTFAEIGGRKCEVTTGIDLLSRTQPGRSGDSPGVLVVGMPLTFPGKLLKPDFEDVCGGNHSGIGEDQPENKVSLADLRRISRSLAQTALPAQVLT